MTRKRWSLLILISILVLTPLSITLFVVSACSRPGTAAPPAAFQIPTDGHRFAFSPNSTLLAVDQQGKVGVYSLGEQILLKSAIKMPDSLIWSLAFTLDSSRLLVSCGGKLHEFDVATERLIRSVEVPGHSVSYFTLCPVNEKVTAVIDHHYSKPVDEAEKDLHSVIAFDLANPTAYKRLITNRIANIPAVRFSRDGQLAIGCDIDAGTLKVWKTANWSLEFLRPATRSHAFAFHPTGDIIGWNDANKDRCYAWSIKDNRPVSDWSTAESIHDMEFLSNGDVAYVSHHYVFTKPLGALLTVRDAKGKIRATHRLTDGGSAYFAMSPDGRYAAAGEHGRVKLWRWNDLVPAEKD
jgi:hypothetical protein